MIIYWNSLNDLAFSSNDSGDVTAQTVQRNSQSDALVGNGVSDAASKNSGAKNLEDTANAVNKKQYHFLGIKRRKLSEFSDKSD
jgi:hypothetical protein